MTSDLSEAEFAAIEAAVATTSRGRSFLVEYARRRRADDATRMLAAIDRLEARAMRAEVDRARLRLESERAAEVVRQLAEVLKDLQPLADARVRARTLAALDAPEPRLRKAGGLENRFAALVQLDARDLDNDIKPFG